MSEQLTREYVESIRPEGTHEAWIRDETLRLMDDNDRLREAAPVLIDAIDDQVVARHPVSPKVLIARSALRAALAVPEGETK